MLRTIDLDPNAWRSCRIDRHLWDTGVNQCDLFPWSHMHKPSVRTIKGERLISGYDTL